VRGRAEQKNLIMEHVEAEQNHRHSLRNTRETASKLGDKLESPVLDQGGSKRVPNSLNNGGKLETTVLD